MKNNLLIISVAVAVLAVISFGIYRNLRGVAQKPVAASPSIRTADVNPDLMPADDKSTDDKRPPSVMPNDDPNADKSSRDAKPEPTPSPNSTQVHPGRGGAVAPYYMPSVTPTATPTATVTPTPSPDGWSKPETQIAFYTFVVLALTAVGTFIGWLVKFAADARKKQEGASGT